MCLEVKGMISKNTTQCRLQKQAFTLIELLVVIAIIAVLMGILMPALSAARKQAATMACQSNMKQIAMAMNLYTMDNQGKTMPFSHTAGEYWFHQLAPFLSAKDYKNDPEGHKEQMKVAFCPTAKKRRTEDDWGTAITAWRFMGGEGSYGLNLWLLPENTLYPEGKANHFKKYTNATGDVPVLGDSVWVGSWPSHADSMPKDLTGESGYPGYPHQAGRFMGRFCIDRHNRAINVGFVDTHVERVPLKDLWLKKWHKNFIPTTEVATL
jgi:prepilin-type N-terminal cleavage/methylation domain-containing protein/prepilin-type processing-associated H-X9-DG protein